MRILNRPIRSTVVALIGDDEVSRWLSAIFIVSMVALASCRPSPRRCRTSSSRAWWDAGRLCSPSSSRHGLGSGHRRGRGGGVLAAVLILVESPWLYLWLSVDHRGRGGMLGCRPCPRRIAVALPLAVGRSSRTWWDAGLLSSPSSNHRGSASGCRSIIEDVVGCWAAVLALVESPWLCLWLSVDHRGRGGMLGCRPRPCRVAVALPLAVGRSSS